MRKLTNEEIEKFASMPNVRRIAVENFLMSMGINPLTASKNWLLDSKLYGWNQETKEAIKKGIKLAMGDE